MENQEHGNRNQENGPEQIREGAASGMTWEVDFPLATNPLVLKQFGALLFFSALLMFVLLSFIFAVTGEFSAIPMVFVITALAVGGLGLLMLLVMLLFFGNRIPVRYTLDEKGLLMENLDQRSKWANRLAVVLGLLAGSPGVAGAGMMAASREKEWTTWKSLSAVSYHPRQRTIVLRNRWRPVQMIICTKDNYGAAAALIAGKVKPSPAAPQRAAKSPLPLLLRRTLLVLLASAPVFAMPYPFELDLLVPIIMLLFALATVWLVPLLGWVVIGCVIFLSAQIVLIGVEEKVSMFGGTYSMFSVLFAEDWFFLLLTFAGLAYLTVYSWRAIRGKTLSALMED